MINKKNVYIGDIKKCTNLEATKLNITDNTVQKHNDFEGQLVDANALLYKTTSGRYFDLNNLYLLELIAANLKMDSIWLKKHGIVLTTEPEKIGDYYLELNSLKKYKVKKTDFVNRARQKILSLKQR